MEEYDAEARLGHDGDGAVQRRRVGVTILGNRRTGPSPRSCGGTTIECHVSSPLDIF